MAYRGKFRGRGRGTLVYSNSRNKLENSTVIQPLPLYPPLTINPLPLQDEPELDYLLKFKRDYRKVLQESEYYSKNYEVKKDIERYSDKYNLANVCDWHPDFTTMPKELKTGKVKNEKPILKKTKIEDYKSLEKVFNNLEANEAKDIDVLENAGEDPENKKPNDDEGEEEQEDEEDFEEDNDYVENYFDNGEDNGDNSDDYEEY